MPGCTNPFRCNAMGYFLQTVKKKRKPSPTCVQVLAWIVEQEDTTVVMFQESIITFAVIQSVHQHSPLINVLCMGAYKRDVVVVIKVGAFIHGVLIFYGCLLSRFYSMCSTTLIKLKSHPFTCKWLFGSYFSVFKLLFTLRTSASAEAPSDPILFDSRLWKKVLQN